MWQFLLIELFSMYWQNGGIHWHIFVNSLFFLVWTTHQNQCFSPAINRNIGCGQYIPVAIHTKIWYTKLSHYNKQKEVCGYSREKYIYVHLLQIFQIQTWYFIYNSVSTDCTCVCVPTQQLGTVNLYVFIAVYWQFNI